MPVLFNHQPRLLVGPTVFAIADGKRVPRSFEGQRGNPLRLIPGRNRIDAAYWEAIKDQANIKVWCRKDKYGKCMIEYLADEEMPDPGQPPSAADLEAMTLQELKNGINDPDVPVEWGKIIQQEIDKRQIEEQAARVKKNLPPVTPPQHNPPDHLREYLDMTVDELVPVIGEMTDKQLLNELLQRATRKTAKKAIAKRLEELDTDDGS